MASVLVSADKDVRPDKYHTPLQVNLASDKNQREQMAYGEGMVADVSFEYPLSVPVPSTAVTT